MPCERALTMPRHMPVITCRSKRSDRSTLAIAKISPGSRIFGVDRVVLACLLAV
jgi:hypothetical protein